MKDEMQGTQINNLKSKVIWTYFLSFYEFFEEKNCIYYTYGTVYTLSFTMDVYKWMAVCKVTWERQVRIPHEVR